MENTAHDNKQILTDLIQKQMVLVGADIVLAKVRSVHGLTVSDDGTVTDIQGEPTVIMHQVVDQFVELSGDIVKQTMEPLLSQQSAQKQAVELPAAPIQAMGPMPSEPTAPTPVVTDPMPTADPSMPKIDPAPTMPTDTPSPVVPTPAPDATPTPTAPEPMPTIEPATAPVVTDPTPMQPMSSPSSDPFPSTQPVPTPAPLEPAVEPAPAMTPPASTMVQPQAPGAAPQPAQQAPNDPDMQHIINEALKQTK